MHIFNNIRNFVKILSISLISFCKLDVCYSQEQLTLNSSSCSNYHKLFNTAKELFYKRNLEYDKIDSLIQTALSTNNNPFSVDLYFAMLFYSKYQNNDKIFQILKMLVDNGVSIKIIRRFIPPSIDKKKLKKSLFKERLSCLYSPEVDKVKQILHSIYINDKKSQGILVGYRTRNRINNSNFQKLKGIVEKINSWPGIGYTHNDFNIHHVDISLDFTQVLLHFNPQQIEELLPYLQRAVENLEISPYHLARVYDYYYIKKTLIKSKGNLGFQYFGVYKINGEVYPVYNPSLLKQRRESFCMIGELLEMN